MVRCVTELTWDPPSGLGFFQNRGYLARTDEPFDRRFKQPGRFCKPEKVAFVDQEIEFRETVSAIILVVEVNPKPHAPSSVVHVDGSAIERVVMDQKDH